MNMEIFEHMQAQELRKYIQFLLWHYRVMDSFWFIYVNDVFDQQTAENINAKVWKRVAGMAAKELVSTFNTKEKGLKGFVEAQKLFPWCILIDYKIEEREDEVIISVPSCPTQVARLKRGLDEFV